MNGGKNADYKERIKNMNQETNDLIENFEGNIENNFVGEEGGRHLEVFDKYGRLYGAATFDGDRHYARTKEIKRELKKALW